MSLNPDPVVPQDEESLIQPGRQISEYDFPPQVSGELQLEMRRVYATPFSDVYRGILRRDAEEPMTVAVKCLRAPSWVTEDYGRFERRIRRETVIWATTLHPNILPFVGYRITPDAAMLISPWCKNGHLKDYILKTPQLTRNDKIKLLIDSARGLLYLHSLEPPIIHGDIKPENVLIQDNLEAALCDFGFSKVQMKLDEHSGLTTSERTSGTIGYMAKEILIEEADPTPSSDVYAFGGLTLTAMSGKPPFWEKRGLAIVLRVSRDEVPLPQSHPSLADDDPLWELLFKCWRSDSAKRPTMSEVIETLEHERASVKSSS